MIATFGRFLLIRDGDHAPRLARPRGRNLGIVCGDRVVCEQQDDHEWIATEVLPRNSCLRRSNQRGRSEALVANLSLLGVVIAPVPAPDFFMVDRYLCAAESAGLRAIVICNKSDLPGDAGIDASLAELAAIGIPVQRVSSREPASLAGLQQLLSGETATLVGQSGVGKSSLIRRLASNADDAVVGELMRIEEGRHTTTAARLYECHTSGRIMDSPGVRDYAPSIDDLDPASLGFREIVRFAPGCRFQDCRHLQEPRCAVQEAVAAGQISARRYESYRRLRRLREQLWELRPEQEKARRPR